MASDIGSSRANVQKLIKKGLVTVDGVVVMDCSYRITQDRRVTVETAEETTDLIPENVPFDVVYEDEHIIVVNKPSGVVVHPGAGNWTGTLVNGLLEYSDTLSSNGSEAMRPGIVHRIDKDTSGILVIAKTNKAHELLAIQFAEHTITRKYVCFVYGVPRLTKETEKYDSNRYIIDTLIGRDRINRKKMKVLPAGGKRAITIFNVLETFGNSKASKIECELKTGRTHQIRVHMSYLGAPLIGDQVYGRRKKLSGCDLVYEFPRQALHAKYLMFKHPITDESLEFDSEIPDDMMQLHNALLNI